MKDTLDVRFTRTADAFYIISLRPPAKHFILPAPLPILPGDTLQLIGGDTAYELPWSWEEGALHIDLTGEVLTREDFGAAWVFEVVYHQAQVSAIPRDEL